MKIPRIWAQLVLISGSAVMVSLIFFIATMNRLFVIPAGVFMLVGIFLTFWKLRCPRCGLRGFRPLWFSEENLTCPRCHAKFCYDDSQRIFDGK